MTTLKGVRRSYKEKNVGLMDEKMNEIFNKISFETNKKFKLKSSSTIKEITQITLLQMDRCSRKDYCYCEIVSNCS